MSLLDKFNTTVTVFPQIETEDAEGNLITKPADVGFATRANVQLLSQSGTSSRKAEQDTIGFLTEEVYRVRFPRDFQELGPQSRIDWDGRSYGILGMPQRYLGSKRTAHIDYIVRRN